MAFNMYDIIYKKEKEANFLKKKLNILLMAM